MSTDEPCIIIVDDDEAIRDSLALLLESAGFARISAYASARTFLDEGVAQAGACLILDIRMPEMNGLELLEELGRRGIRIPVIIMTGHGDVPIAVRAMKAGAFDFIEKPFADDLLLDSLRRALAISHQANRESEEIDETRRRVELLTAREREVLEGLVSGRPNKVIAYDMGISPRTVEIHRARVMEKMQARSLSALVRMALAAGFVPRSG